MKQLPWIIILAMTLSATAASAQSIEQAKAAFAKGDYATALSGYTRLAENGDTIAQLSLGMMHVLGAGVPVDGEKAASWFKKAAAQGNVDAYWLLGAMYYQGQNIAKNDLEAVNWFRQAAKSGNVDAQRYLDVMSPSDTQTTSSQDQSGKQIKYRVRDIGTLGGKSCFASGMNSKGQVVGVSYDKKERNRAFITGPNGAGITDLGTLGGNTSRAHAVNESGQVAGSAEKNDSWRSRAFITGPDGKNMRELDNEPGAESEAKGINAKGQVFFSMSVGGSPSKSYITGPDGKGKHELPQFFRASSINDNGVIAGTIYVDARIPAANVLYANAASLASDTLAIKNISVLAGDKTQSDAYGINDKGQIVGQAENKESYKHAFITAPDGKSLIDLGALRKDADSQANSINKQGQVVGWSAAGGKELYAFVTEANGANMRDINTLVSLPAGISLTNAVAINDRGQIITAGSNSFCYLLSPLVETAKIPLR
ncbi:hypothetical protein [Undibacterium sp. TS12]|uniref:hypothetical protein n=1 Tax=Undibacterium sp. TS12 TaxID=2908202 RepID=UPI001F4C5AF0|nr:hypothetical protein [Undibacterium sp. TS12]MCH8620543.1 hypothetical protein [Undibacterium sp. TS12]